MSFFQVSAALKRASQAIAATIVFGVMLSATSSVLADNGLDNAKAELRTLNDSGISGEVEFKADGSELTIEGKAEGMDPAGSYVSLLYDNLSVATGAFACEPGFDNFGNIFLGATADAPGRITLAEMGVDVLGVGPLLVWVADDDDERTVNGTVDVNLDRVRTISIRDLNINGGFGPMAVAACGLIVSDD